MYKKTRLLKVLFAPDGGASEGGTAENATNESTSTNTTQTAETPTPTTDSEKMFSQSELNRLLAAEKKQGKSAILKELGFTDANAAKKALEDLKAYQDSQKTLEQKYADLQKEAETLKTAQASELAAMQIKLDAVKMGINPDALDDFAALAIGKVTDGKDLAAVIKEMQKNPIYSGFFNSPQPESKGTGGSPVAGGSKNTPTTENIGERLAKARSQQVKESPYFK